MTFSSPRPAGLADRVIDVAAAAAVVVEAVIAAAVSYSHIYALGLFYGQAGYAARLLPVSIDGLIVAAGMFLLREARAGRSAPFLARALLWLGVASTIVANGAAGARHGPGGAVLSAVPAAAFVGAAELTMIMIRRRNEGQAAELDPAAAAAALRYADELRERRIPTLKVIRADLAVGQPRAQRIRAHLAELAADLAAA